MHTRWCDETKSCNKNFYLGLPHSYMYKNSSSQLSVMTEFIRTRKTPAEKLLALHSVVHSVWSDPQQFDLLTTGPSGDTIRESLASWTRISNQHWRRYSLRYKNLLGMGNHECSWKILRNIRYGKSPPFLGSFFFWNEMFRDCFRCHFRILTLHLSLTLSCTSSFQQYIYVYSK